MTSEELRALTAKQAALLPALLFAMWHQAQGHWSAAHEVAQAEDTREGAWVHAYLHRQEGDDWNAAYWYRRAGKPVISGPLEAEWEGIVRSLLAADAL
jgi:hypothetical protein